MLCRYSTTTSAQIYKKWTAQVMEYFNGANDEIYNRVPGVYHRKLDNTMLFRNTGKVSPVFCTIYSYSLETTPTPTPPPTHIHQKQEKEICHWNLICLYLLHVINLLLKKIFAEICSYKCNWANIFSLLSIFHFRSWLKQICSWLSYVFAKIEKIKETPSFKIPLAVHCELFRGLNETKHLVTDNFLYQSIRCCETSYKSGETIRQLSQQATDLSIENFISFWNGDQMELLMKSMCLIST